MEQIKGLSYWFKLEIKYICNFSTFISDFIILN